MQKEFKEFYQYTQPEIKKIWRTAIFIFDTNILQSLYRFNQETRDDFLNTLRFLKKNNRIWSPHQVLFEYHKNRRNVIIGLEKDYQEAINTITSYLSSFSKKFEGSLISACENHPLLNKNELSTKIEKNLKIIAEDINKTKSKHPDWKNNDSILKEIEQIFSNYGNKYSEEELKTIVTEGKKRYENKIPPGYADDKDNGGNKEGNNKYGDLIIWKQILDFSKTIDVPIIFVTNDEKHDWWIYEYNKPFAPRFELKKEILNIGNIDFQMYNSDDFLEKTKEYLNQEIKNESIEEVKRMRRSTDIRNNFIHKQLKDKYNLKPPKIKEFIFTQNTFNFNLLCLIDDLDLNEDEIVYNIKRNQTIIMNLLTIISSEERIQLNTINKILNIQKAMYSMLIQYYKMKKINNESLIKLSDYFETVISFYLEAKDYFDLVPESFEIFNEYFKQNQRKLSGDNYLNLK